MNGQIVWKKVDSLVPGDTSMETVRTRNDQPPLVHLGQVVTQEVIETLKANDVKYLWVQISQITPPVVNPQKIEKLKEEMKDIFQSAVEKMQVNKNEIRNLSSEIVNDIVKNYSDKISLIFLIQQNDEEYTYIHEIHVGMISVLIGVEIGMKINDLSRLAFSSIIHDIGKIMVPKEVLYAPRKLTEKEFEMVKKHVEYGAKICEKSNVEDPRIISGVRDHHEKLDGTGYLRGLTKDQLGLEPRIIAIADVYDALIANRSYKPSWSPYKVVSELVKMASFNKLDKELVQAFVSVVGLYPVGTTVLLSNGEKAIVTGNTMGHKTQPIVRVASGEYIDLAEEKKLSIVQVLD